MHTRVNQTSPSSLSISNRIFSSRPPPSAVFEPSPPRPQRDYELYYRCVERECVSSASFSNVKSPLIEKETKIDAYGHNSKQTVKHYFFDIYWLLHYRPTETKKIRTCPREHTPLQGETKRTIERRIIPRSFEWTYKTQNREIMRRRNLLAILPVLALANEGKRSSSVGQTRNRLVIFVR